MDEQQHPQSIFVSTPLEQVHEGMSVIDADGRSLGSVTRLQMGDPQAVTTAGNEPLTSPEPGVFLAPAAATQAGAGVLGLLWGSDVEGLGDVPDVLRRDLRRAGFVEVDGAGLEGANRFIPGDRIAEVYGNTVRLHPALTAPAVPDEVPPASPTATDTAPRPVADNQPVERLVVTPVRHDATAGRALAPRVLVSGGASAAVLGSAGIAIWLYRRWRREQARPINRLRRGTARLRDRLAENAPVGNGAIGGALLLVLLAAVRWSRRGTPQAERAERVESETTNSDACASAQPSPRMLPTFDNLPIRWQEIRSDRNRPGVRTVAGLLAVLGVGVLISRRARASTSTAEASHVQHTEKVVQKDQTPKVPVHREEMAFEGHPIERQPLDRPIGEGGHEAPLHGEQVTIETLLGSSQAPTPAERQVQDAHSPSMAPDEQAPDAKEDRPA